VIHRVGIDPVRRVMFATFRAGSRLPNGDAAGAGGAAGGIDFERIGGGVRPQKS